MLREEVIANVAFIGQNQGIDYLPFRRFYSSNPSVEVKVNSMWLGLWLGKQ